MYLINLKSLILFVILASASCSDKGEDTVVYVPQPEVEVVPYTSLDATTAFEAFNRQFYNPEAKLYYSTTEKTDLGSIWTQAIFWDIVMDAYERTNKPEYLNLIEEIYEGGYEEYDAYNWENTVEWFIYDDIMWWLISLTRAHEITGEAVYLEKAISGFDRVWRDSYDPDQGGMYWNFQKSGKNACINYPTVIAAIKLYGITGEEEYLNKAKEIYAWSRENLFQVSTGRVADHKVGNNPPGFEDYTYNQGTLIGAAVLLYKETGEFDYIEDSILAADYTKNEMADSDGILPAEGDWNEQGVLKAIFGRYLMLLVEEGGQEQYEPWLRKNADLAWHNRDKYRDITYRNYKIPCPILRVQSYEASSAVGIMQVCPPERN